MLLYKYLSPERIDVLEKCMIRFTQAAAFNDPFELNPHISKLIEESVGIPMMEDMFKKSLHEEYCRNPFLMSTISFEAFCLMAKKNTSAQDLYKLTELFSPMMKEMVPKELKSRLGILSLSENNGNILMWSHYALEHKGFSIGFNSKLNISR